MKLTPAHRELIRLLAEVSVDEFLEEQTSRARTMTPDAAAQRNELRNGDNLTPIRSERKPTVW